MDVTREHRPIVITTSCIRDDRTLLALVNLANNGLFMHKNNQSGYGTPQTFEGCELDNVAALISEIRCMVKDVN